MHEWFTVVYRQHQTAIHESEHARRDQGKVFNFLLVLCTNFFTKKVRVLFKAVRAHRVQGKMAVEHRLHLHMYYSKAVKVRRDQGNTYFSYHRTYYVISKAQAMLVSKVKRITIN